MRLKSLVVAAAAAGLLAPAFAQAQAQFKDGDWMVRVRAVDLLFQNGQGGGNGSVAAYKIKAENQVIPEFDVSYFFTKNIAAELVLTWPQNISIDANLGSGNQKVGTIKALPPSLVLQYHFTDLGAVKPYVGVGVNYTTFTNRSNFPTAPINNTITVDSSSWGFVGQVGLDYMFDKNWGVNVDVKYITMATNINSTSGTVNLGKLTLNPWTPGIGIAYKF